MCVKSLSVICNVFEMFFIKISNNQFFTKYEPKIMFPLKVVLTCKDQVK